MTTAKTIKVTNDPTFRRNLAEKVVLMSHPGYCGDTWYADVATGKLYQLSHSNLFTPWNEQNSYRVYPVLELVNPGCDYSPEVESLREWKSAIESHGISFYSLIEDYLREGHEWDDTESSLEDWAQLRAKEAIEWAKTQPNYKDILQSIEDVTANAAIDLAESEIFDEIIIKEEYL